MNHLILAAVVFVVTALSCGFFVLLNQKINFGQDKLKGVQKFHLSPTSRLGGFAIMLGLLTADFLIHLFLYKSYGLFDLLLLSSLPIFLGGITEDFTHHVPPSTRLLLALFSASFVFFLTGISVERTDVFFIDFFLQWTPIAFLVTLLVIAGFSHSINIIDGFNGLASGQIIFMLGFLAYLNYAYAQEDLFFICILLECIVIAFFFWNWPKGKIFLGDGGAYLLGFFVVSMGLILVQRRPEISPFTPILIGIAPLVEALFSIYRRALIKKRAITKPDALHLHTLVYRRIIKLNPGTSKFSPTTLNSLVGPFFWFSSFMFSFFSVAFCENKFPLMILFLSYIILYLWLFKRLISFNNPFKHIFKKKSY